jgi:hypothetical protein
MALRDSCSCEGAPDPPVGFRRLFTALEIREDKAPSMVKVSRLLRGIQGNFIIGGQEFIKTENRYSARISSGR